MLREISMHTSGPLKITKSSSSYQQSNGSQADIQLLWLQTIFPNNFYDKFQVRMRNHGKVIGDDELKTLESSLNYGRTEREEIALKMSR